MRINSSVIPVLIGLSAAPAAVMALAGDWFSAVMWFVMSCCGYAMSELAHNRTWGGALAPNLIPLAGGLIYGFWLPSAKFALVTIAATIAGASIRVAIWRSAERDG